MYDILFTRSAKKELEKIPKKYYGAIRTHISELAENPRPYGCTKLKGTDNEYRIRVGTYRIIYSIQDSILRVEVIRVATRGEAYE